MGLLEKLGILSEVNEGGNAPPPKTDATPAVKSAGEGNNSHVVSAPVEVDPNVAHEDVVKQAYSEFPESKENIFVVENLLKGFEVLPEQQRYSTVQSTLKTMGKDVNAFIIEAQKRIKAINSALSQRTEIVNQRTSQITNTIEEAKKKIDELSQTSLDLNNGLDLSKKECEIEVKRLQKIITVLGGGEK